MERPQPTGPDEHMAADIEEAFAEDPRVNEQALQVRVAGGVVEVRGVVSTAAQHQGIVDVLNELLPDHRVALDVRITADELTESGGEERLT